MREIKLPWNWTCPFCDRAQTVSDQQCTIQGVGLPLAIHKYENLGAQVLAIACANQDCLEVTVSLHLNKLSKPPGELNYHYRDSYDRFAAEAFEVYPIRPGSSSKQQPEFIPAPLREDYYEACLIKRKSPKSSATLARRCLQGMIRDFCGISKGTLGAEIEALRKKVEEGSAPRGVTEESIEAIDAVRSIGSIGAHMEKDINVIVDVDPGEAQSLIELIELLFDEWYTAQHKRSEKVARVAAIAAEKKAELAEAKAKLLTSPEK